MGRIFRTLLMVLALHASALALTHCGLGGTDCGNVTCPSHEPPPQSGDGTSAGGTGDGEGAGSVGGPDDPQGSPGPEEHEYLLQGGGH